MTHPCNYYFFNLLSRIIENHAEQPKSIKTKTEVISRGFGRLNTNPDSRKDVLRKYFERLWAICVLIVEGVH